MKRGREVGLSPGHIVLDGDAAAAKTGVRSFLNTGRGPAYSERQHGHRQ